jgi:ABC-type Zn uptake system ZnuABC Zn-binding protein ZnuA
MAVAGALVLVAAACGGDDATTDPAETDADDKATVVVTHSVLGAVVSDLVGDAAEVVVLMPNGADPHDWEASAKDIEKVNSAAVVVANGLQLEESLLDTLETAGFDGLTIFYASDHIDVRTIGEGEIGTAHEDEDHAHEEEGHSDEEEAHSDEEEGHSDEEEAHSDEEEAHSDEEEAHSDEEEAHSDEDEDHAHEDEDHADEKAEGDDHDHDHGEGAEDPHLWMDPIAMSDVVAALAPVLAEAGVDVTDRVDEVQADLEALDAEVADTLSVIADDDRQLVSGHESLGYFADRYDFSLVGAVIPSLTSQAEASAGDLAELRETMEAAGVTTIFTEIGTPDSVVQAIADEAGAQVIELGTHTLPDDGTYRTFMLDIATLVADGLTA